jgi:hypothetical protein
VWADDENRIPVDGAKGSEDEEDGVDSVEGIITPHI